MKKQGLIAVDLDGTLIDTVAVNAESYRRALESFGFTLDYDYYAAYTILPKINMLFITAPFCSR